MYSCMYSIHINNISVLFINLIFVFREGRACACFIRDLHTHHTPGEMYTLEMNTSFYQPLEG